MLLINRERVLLWRIFPEQLTASRLGERSKRPQGEFNLIYGSSGDAKPHHPYRVNYIRISGSINTPLSFFSKAETGKEEQ